MDKTAVIKAAAIHHVENSTLRRVTQAASVSIRIDLKLVQRRRQRVGTKM